MIDNTGRNHSQTEGDVNLTEERKNWNAGIKGALTNDILEKDAKYFLHQSLSTPCLDVIDSSNGIDIINLEGKIYIDFHGNNVHHLGYQNSYILERVKAQLDLLPFSPRRFTNLPAVNLAEELIRLTSGKLSRVLFSPGGASAMSMALKLARVATGKYKTISMYGAFHGASMDSISVGGEYMFRQQLGPLLPGNILVPPPDSYRGIWYNDNLPEGDLAYADYVEYIIEKEGDIGAVIAETIRSTTVHIPSHGYWKRIREICDKHQVLLIMDEIPIGMGRTGSMFAYQYYGIVPDMLVLGKGLGAGIVPMAAMLCREELNVAGHVALGHFTHEKNPLGATAALAALDYMKEYNVLEHVHILELWMRSRLEGLQKQFEAIGQVRGIGLLWGIELVKSRETKEKDIQLAERVLYRCLKNGLSIKVSDGNVLSLYPPLIITETELSNAMMILEEAIRDAMGIKKI
ncbi:aspartate aminotransferase family protein [Arcticibacter eurypsychrophilus]|uniref:aspartate aminotransferase family protein n=1 Tax=Arcticibacter eurypsychrophilus TaxID=1434752 RepID=UPI00084DE8EA|nr:aspartate aminotransferase family protein [Arcticibacter eurypsychrophilus]